MLRTVSTAFALTVIAATVGYAQLSEGSVDSVNGSAAIYLQHTLFGAKYIQFGEEHPAGGSYGKLAVAMADVPEAYELARTGSRIVTHGRLIALLGAAVGATTFFVHGETWELGISAAGFVVAGIGGAIQMKGKNRIDEGVWIHNEYIKDR
jgi:hypothetical protein